MTGAPPIRISHEEVLARLAGIVTDTSPYRPRLTDKVAHRALLWAFDVPLHEQGFGSLCRALRAIGDERFVYGQIERFPQDDDSWIVPCDDYRSYNSVEAFVESLLCSVDAKWVILCSSEGHSVAASATSSFIAALADEVGVRPLEDGMELVDHWREVYDMVVEPGDLRAGAPDWIPSLLEQFLSPEIAAAVGSHHQAPRLDT